MARNVQNISLELGLGVCPQIVIPEEGIHNHRIYIGIMDGFLYIRDIGEGINLIYFITSSNGLEVDGHSHVGKVDFDENRARNYHPSCPICVDESMSRWYGIVGHQINAGLPQYIAIDRKPGNGCEIQNAVDGVSGITIQLKLVKTYSEEDLHYPEGHDGLLHSTKVMLNILQPWVNKQRLF